MSSFLADQGSGVLCCNHSCASLFFDNLDICILSCLSGNISDIDITEPVGSDLYSLSSVSSRVGDPLFCT